MQTFRKILFWLHLICGVIAGIAIFIMCVTGALLSFEKNILEFAESGARNVAIPANAKPLTIGELTAKLLEQRPKIKPSAIAVESSPTRSVAFSIGREGQVYVDPYTGDIIGEGSGSLRTFFSVSENLHRWLAIGGDGRVVGKTINDASNFVFLILAITGIYIWLPRKFTWQHLRPVLWFRGGVKGYPRDFNWHNTIGFWTSLVLIILTLTGVVMSYQWANNLVYSLTGNPVPQQQGPPGGGPPQNGQAEQSFALPENIDTLWQTAATQAPGWRSISLRLPVAKEASFTIDEGKSLNIFGRSALTVDAATASVSKWEPFTEQNSGRQLRSWIRFTHTGESFGIVGQFIGFIACIGGAVLVYTGLLMALHRFRNWLRKRSRITETA